MTGQIRVDVDTTRALARLRELDAQRRRLRLTARGEMAAGLAFLALMVGGLGWLAPALAGGAW